MATTRLMPLHTGKGRTAAEALGRTTDYVKNPEKTEGGELVTAYQCNPSIADQEFLFSKRQYAALTGRSQKEHDVIVCHLRQSFKPGEITPELANKIGYELAMPLTKGNTLSSSVPMWTSNISTRILCSIPPPWTVPGSSIISGDRHLLSEKSPTYFAGKTACRSLKIQSPAGAATAVGWVRNRRLSENNWSG